MKFDLSPLEKIISKKDDIYYLLEDFCIELEEKLLGQINYEILSNNQNINNNLKNWKIKLLDFKEITNIDLFEIQYLPNLDNNLNGVYNNYDKKLNFNNENELITLINNDINNNQNWKKILFYLIS